MITQRKDSSEEVLYTLAWLFHVLESGATSVFTNKIETFHVKVKEEKIYFDLMNTELLTDLLQSIGLQRASLLNKLRTLKTIAQDLKREGHSLIISYRGSLLMTLGAEAKPTFSHLLTGTDAIEIHDLYRLNRLLSNAV